MLQEPVEIYIHIPFCKRKCNYCDFLSYSAQPEIRAKYVEALLDQIRVVGAGILPGDDPSNYDDDDSIIESKIKVCTVYIGGGTPSVLTPEQIDRILCQLKDSFDVLPDAEITMEANPGTLNKDAIKKLYNTGINRISLGLQSANADELEMLGRIHTYEQFEECYVNCRTAGFKNINVDIMTALPKQTPDTLTNTLSKVIALGPEHISAYSLIIEEETPFYELYGDIDGPVVGEETERKLYYLMRDKLIAAGYEHYEISNFAKSGFESRHNCGYWTRVPYLGLGLGASSFFDIYRVTNTESMSEYLKNPEAFSSCTRLSENDAMEEFMFLGLRMMKGVSRADFGARYNSTFDSVYGKVTDKLMAKGLLVADDDRIFLTKDGIDHGNFVFSQFLL